MKHFPRLLAVCLGGAFILCAGCDRTDTESQIRPKTPERAPQDKPGGRKMHPNKRQERVKLNQLESEALPPQANASVAHNGETPVKPGALEVQTKRPGNGDQELLVKAGTAQVLTKTPALKSSEPQTKPNGKPLGAKKREVDAIFSNPTVFRIQIEIPRAGLNTLRHTRWENGEERPVVKATIREGGVVYTNVAIHLKGAAGSFRNVDEKPAMTLNFDRFVPDQSFHGLHKISLNNSVQDSTYLCEKIAREIFIAAGVPVPRATHAVVELNGQDLGFYVVLEGANKQFLKRYFDNAKGNLYDGGFCRDIDSSLSVNCGENPKNHTGLRALRAIVNEGRPNYARLEKVLDTDRFISMVVIEMLLCHWDGYTLNRNNWRVFHDLDSNRMVFIPHGLDQLFGAGRQFDPGSPITPQHLSGTVSRAVLASVEGHRKYLERVGQLYTNVFKVDEILARVDEVARGVSRELAESHPQIAKSIQQRAGSLKQRIIRRDEGLRRQLGGSSNPVEFTGDGVLPLAGWKPSLVQSGDPKLTQRDDPAGKRILAIDAGTGVSSSSWRARVMLAPGRYQFQGRVKLMGVTVDSADQRGGAGLRISKGTMPRKLAGTSEWKDYKYAFEVEDQGSEVELICELRATAGEAWFEAGSLKLVRMP
ncbi:MAG: CotH kinase family protein [Verrucomicrobiota bacterium]